MITLPSYSHYEATLRPAPDRFHLHEILGALSHAIDMTEGQPPGHAMRCCWIGMHIGKTLDLPEAQMADLFYTLLLKDLGCSSNAARICALYLADDIGFKRDFKKIDGSLNAALRFVFQKTGLQSGLSERIRATLNILRNGGDISRELIETRCHQGADIAAKLRFSAAVQDGIRSLDERWDGSGKPEGLGGDAIPILSRIALLSQVVDVFFQDGGRRAAWDEIQQRSGTWFDPQVVAAFTTAAANTDDFWAGLHINTEPLVYGLAPKAAGYEIDDDYLDDIAEGFADVIDAKSPFTADHSRRVTLYADMIAEEVGLSEPHRRWIRRAALLHDIGKLAVSNQILDKPGRPSEEEWASIRAHPAHSEAILERVTAFRDIAPVAGAHHERLDGKGYPNGKTEATLPFEAMILATADVYDALSADRPYREAMTYDAAMEILNAELGAAHHRVFVEALARGLARFSVAAAPKSSELMSISAEKDVAVGHA